MCDNRPDFGVKESGAKELVMAGPDTPAVVAGRRDGGIFKI